MSESDFETLVALIETLISIKVAGEGHYGDKPRQDALARDRDFAISIARSQLVL